MELDHDELHGVVIGLAEVELGLLEARVGGCFNYTSELHAMKHDQTLAGLDTETWKVEMKNEHD